LFVLLNIVLTAAKISAQNPVWALSDGNYIEMTGSGAATINNTFFGSNPIGFCLSANNAISDFSGLKFAFNDASLVDEGFTLNLQMQKSPGDLVHGLTEAIIVPVPGECSNYYIITADKTNNTVLGDPEVFYSKLDISDPTLPKLINVLTPTNTVTNCVQLTNINNLSAHTGTLQIAMTKLNTNNERFLFVAAGQGILYRYKVTNTGITYDSQLDLNAITNATNGGSIFNGSSIIRSEMEISEHLDGSYSIAIPGDNSSWTYSGTYFGSVGVFNFNNLNTFVNWVEVPILNLNTVNIAYRQKIRGIEFSSNGDYLYVTHNTAPYLTVYDCVNQTKIPLPINTPNLAAFKFSQIECGVDKNLYFTSSTNLAKISNTNNPTSLSFNLNFLSYAQPLSINDGTHDDWNGPVLKDTLYLLPDQVDNEFHNLNFANPACCEGFTSDYSFERLTIRSNSTWSPGTGNPYNTAVIKVKDELRIPAGVKVILRDMTFEFSSTANVIIEPGGELELQGTTFTTIKCNNMWLGVEVWGTTGSLISSSQGKITLISNNSGVTSKIMNAVNGIRAWKANDYSMSGGLVIATNAEFINCYRGIEFVKNNLGNNSGFQSILSNCKFVCTSNLLPPYTANTRTARGFTAWDVQNIILSGAQTRFTNIEVGIRLVESSLDVNNTIFTDCLFGIHSDNSGNSAYISQHDFSSNTFNNVHTCINIIAGSRDRIVGNIFNAQNSTDQSNNFYGVYLDKTTEFTIQDNTFNRMRYGVYVINSLELESRIEYANVGNQFLYCWRGIHTKGNNSGLKITCNSFVNSISAAWFIGGTLANQGLINIFNPSLNKPAGNTFTHAPTPSYREIFSVAGTGGANFIYVHSLGAAYIPTVNSATRVNLVNTLQPLPNGYCASDPFFYKVIEPELTKTDILNQLDPARKEYMISKLVEWYNSNNQLPLAIEYLETLQNDAATLRLIPAYIFSNNLVDAQYLIQELINSGNNEQVDQGLLYNIVLTWKIENRSPYQMDSSEEVTIRQIAAHYTSASEQARSIIEMVFDEKIYLSYQSDTAVYRLSESELSSISAITEYVLSKTSISNQFVISRSDGNFINCNMATLYTAQGRKIKEYFLNCDYACEITLPELQKSIYLLQLTNENSPLTTLKLNN